MALMALLPWNERRGDRLLHRLARTRAPVSVEVEGTSIHFVSRVAVRGNAVVVARPRRFGQKIPVGAWLRVYPHEGSARSGVRMRVRTPLFLLHSGNTVIVADPPSGVAAANLRSYPRFDTSRYREVMLGTNGVEQRFPVLDLSIGGCRAALSRHAAEQLLPLREHLHRGSLYIARQRIRLSTLLPVSYRDGSVGISFSLRDDDKSPEIFRRFVGKLADINARRFRVNPAV